MDLPTTADQYITLAEVAEILGVDASLIKRWSLRGDFPPLVSLSARCYVIRKGRFDSFMEEKESEFSRRVKPEGRRSAPQSPPTQFKRKRGVRKPVSPKSRKQSGTAVPIAVS